jgi:hypothetical protein
VPRKPRNNDTRAKEHLQVVGRYDEGILGKGGKCNHLKKDGKTRCTLPAGKGTDHVGFGACVAHGGNAPAMKKHAARQEGKALGDELDMDPFVALAWTVRLSAGAVAFYREKMQEIQPEMDPAVYAVMADLFGEERDRLSRHSKTAIDAGIDAKRLELEVAQAQLFAHALQAILGELKLTPEQKRKAPQVVRKHMEAIEAQAV